MKKVHSSLHLDCTRIGCFSSCFGGKWKEETARKESQFVAISAKKWQKKRFGFSAVTALNISD